MSAGSIPGVRTPAKRGLFITLEGPDGSGKTTQAALLAEWFREQGREVVLTREPGGGGPVAEDVRRLLLHAGDMARSTEVLLFFAARSENVHGLILPALERGAVVLCDRYTDSTLAYQGAGLGASNAEIRNLHRFATGDLWPDLTLVLDLEPNAGLERQNQPNRMEERGLTFARLVREGFLKLAAAEPHRIAVVDASGCIEDVQQKLRRCIEERLGGRPCES